ncbi:MAG: GTP cyclohydrolase FolE2 [Pseudobdellovibrionaceae bacterium]
MKLPDIASDRPELSLAGALDWVGMRGIEVPIFLLDQEGHLYRTAARASTFVSLENQDSRGIHMSRLFKDLQAELGRSPLDFPLMAGVLDQFLSSHEGLSQKAKLEVEFQALAERKALKSDNKGWRTYPVKMSASLQKAKEPRFYLETLVTYSSTCPASAALSRHLIQENFKNHFRGQDLDFKDVYDFLGTTHGIIATPHAQRSQARVKVEINPTDGFNFDQLIGLVEEALQTPVQTLVKREDEQEFALRNGQNLMFCEDAARRVQAIFMQEPSILDFIAQMSHLESLHPHDAVSVVSRGLELHSFE